MQRNGEATNCAPEAAERGLLFRKSAAQIQLIDKTVGDEQKVRKTFRCFYSAEGKFVLEIPWVLNVISALSKWCQSSEMDIRKKHRESEKRTERVKKSTERVKKVKGSTYG